MENGPAFLAKIYLLENPYLSTLVIFTAVIVASSVGLYISERNDRELDDGGIESSLINSFWDSAWLCVVTASTVGYGDMVPLTHIGKFIAFFVAIIGSFLIALVVLAVT